MSPPKGGVAPTGGDVQPVSIDEMRRIVIQKMAQSNMVPHGWRPDSFEIEAFFYLVQIGHEAQFRHRFDELQKAHRPQVAPAAGGAAASFALAAPPTVDAATMRLTCDDLQAPTWMQSSLLFEVPKLPKRSFGLILQHYFPDGAGFRSEFQRTGDATATIQIQYPQGTDVSVSYPWIRRSLIEFGVGKVRDTIPSVSIDSRKLLPAGFGRIPAVEPNVDSVGAESPMRSPPASSISNPCIRFPETPFPETGFGK
eukprot:GDKH01022810.1.p1 GENE.GDKH01022810.1~~GDKH01022810.1.p1  ORF type:complete len:254 (-),score=7.08 GDKH01022810.1:588-1349(-)